MSIKALFSIALTLFIATTAFSQDLTFKGDIEIELSQPLFEAGGELNAEITLYNQENFPMADAYVIVEIVKGGQFFYPSQMNDGDNVFFEKKIANINIAENSSKKIGFNYKLPENLASGSYRLDVYFKNERAGIVGIPHIFLNPESAYFSYFGQGSMPEAKIVRSKTVFNNTPGPVGFPAEPNSTIQGSVFIENISGNDLANLELLVMVCDWDDTACDKFESTKETAIDSLKVGEEKQISIQLQAPSRPSAYAVRIELRNSNNDLLSLYRNRIIVTGATKRIHQLYLNKFYFKAGETVEIAALIGPSPDHFNNPVLRGSKLVLSVKDVETGGTLFNQSIDLPDEIDFPEKKASFATAAELKKFEVCGGIEKDATVYDEYCFVIDSAEFAATQKSQIKADWSYDKIKELLKINFCALSPDLLVQPINVIYYLQQAGKTIANEEINSNECTEKQFALLVGTYDLIINNLDTNKQSKETINLAEYIKQCANLNCDDSNPCTSNNCSNGECNYALLADGTACGDGKICREGTCMEGNIVMQYLPYGALVIIVVVIFLAYTYSKRRKEK